MDSWDQQFVCKGPNWWLCKPYGLFCTYSDLLFRVRQARDQMSKNKPGYVPIKLFTKNGQDLVEGSQFVNTCSKTILWKNASSQHRRQQNRSSTKRRLPHLVSLSCVFWWILSKQFMLEQKVKRPGMFCENPIPESWFCLSISFLQVNACSCLVCDFVARVV